MSMQAVCDRCRKISFGEDFASMEIRPPNHVIQKLQPRGMTHLCPYCWDDFMQFMGVKK